MKMVRTNIEWVALDLRPGFLLANGPSWNTHVFLRNKSAMLWEMLGKSGGIPHLAKNERDGRTRRLVKGLEPKKARFFHPPLATGKRVCSKARPYRGPPIQCQQAAALFLKGRKEIS
jgi:hypothetical protein